MVASRHDKKEPPPLMSSDYVQRLAQTGKFGAEFQKYAAKVYGDSPATTEKSARIAVSECPEDPPEKKAKTSPREKRSKARSKEGGDANTSESLLRHVLGSVPGATPPPAPGSSTSTGPPLRSSRFSVPQQPPVRLTAGVDPKLLTYLKSTNTLSFWQMVSKLSGTVLQELVTPAMLEASNVSYLTWEELTDHFARIESEKINASIVREYNFRTVEAIMTNPTREAIKITLEYTGSGQYGIEQATASLRKDTRLFEKVGVGEKTYDDVVQDLMTRQELRPGFARLVALHIRLPNDMNASRRIKFSNTIDNDFALMRDTIRELAHYYYDSDGELQYSASLLSSSRSRAIVNSVQSSSDTAPLTSYELSDMDRRRLCMQQRIGRKRIYPSSYHE